MTRDQFRGQVREILNVAGAAVGTWGLASGDQVAAVCGVLLSVVMLIWGLRAKDAAEAVFSMVRKLAGAVGAMMVVFEMIEPERADALLAVLGPVFALVSSHWFHGGRKF